MRNASISIKGVGCARAADQPLQVRAWLIGPVIHVASPHGRMDHDDFSDTVVDIHAVLNIHQPTALQSHGLFALARFRRHLSTDLYETLTHDVYRPATEHNEEIFG